MKSNILFLLHQEWFDIFKPLINELQNNKNNINIHFNEKDIYKKNLEFLITNNITLVQFKAISTNITKVLKKTESKNSISQYICEKILFIEFNYHYKIVKRYLQHNNIAAIYLHTDINWRLEVAITKAAKDLFIPVIIPSSILMEPDISNIRNNEDFYINSRNSWYQSKTFNKFKSKKYGVQTYENHFRYKAYILNFLHNIDSLSTSPFVFGGSPNTTHLYVCNKYSKEIAIKNGVKASKITITGDISYDILYESYRNKDIIKKSIIKNQDKNKKIVIFGVPQLYEHGYTSKEVAIRDIENIIRNITGNNTILLFLSLHPMMEKENYIYLEKKYHCFILNQPLVKVLPIADLYIAAVSNTLNWSVLCNINTIAFDFYNWDMKLADTLRSIEFVKKREQMQNSIQKMLYKKVNFTIDNDLISKKIVFDGNSMKRHLNYNGDKNE